MTSCKFRKDVPRMVTYWEVIVVRSSIPHSIPVRLLDIVLLGSVRQLICTVVCAMETRRQQHSRSQSILVFYFLRHV